MSNSFWFQRYGSNENSKIRLFCFPYAGGRAEIFQSWQQSLDPTIEVIAINYPGRGKRIATPSITDCKTLVADLLPELMSYTDKPFSLFGHSMGALISFELAKQLQANGISGLKHLFLSARRAVNQVSNNTHFHTLPDDKFIKMLQEMGGTPQEVFAYPELLSLFIPILKSDFKLSETYKYHPSPKIKTTTTILYSSEDQYVQKEQITGWQDLIDGKTDFIELPGGHFFIHHEEQKITKLINNRLLETM